MTTEQNNNNAAENKEQQQQEAQEKTTYAVRPHHHYKRLDYSDPTNLKVRTKLNTALILLVLVAITMWYTMDTHTTVYVVLCVGVKVKIAEICILCLIPVGVLFLKHTHVLRLRPVVFSRCESVEFYSLCLAVEGCKCQKVFSLLCISVNLEGILCL